MAADSRWGLDEITAAARPDVVTVASGIPITNCYRPGDTELATRGDDDDDVGAGDIVDLADSDDDE